MSARTARTVLTRCAVVATAALLVACSSAADEQSLPTTGSTATTPSAAPVAPESVIASAPQEPAPAGEDHSADDGHDHGDEEGLVEEGEDPDEHDHGPIAPLEGGDLGWYDAFCSAAGVLMQSPEPDLSAGTDEAERTAAYVAWLQEISDRIDPATTELTAQDPVAVGFGALIQEETAVVLADAKVGAATAINGLSQGLEIDGIAQGEDGWLESTVASYTEKAAGMNSIVEFYRDALVPEDQVEQITAIGNCSEILAAS